ncbi:MAG: hypothetical protein C0469_02890 [Cyanobacteria bacterium DS2.3.42]|nr:hypothetical protein [Cyanobacteria bacterium DS2.3.42]
MNNTLQTDSTTQRPAVFLKSVPARIYIDLCLILVLVIAVFGRTLTSYFLADDFGEIRYLHRICTGDFNLLVANFTGNYMQIPGMSVYRPFLLLSLLIDFIIWKTNAAGFYATNLIFYYLDAVLLYLIVLKLGSSNSLQKNRLTALTASVLFAVSPLHCESVSWVLGRVDIVCAFFYLLSFYLLFLSLEKRSRKVTGFAIAAFISGLLVKEMAIGIPVIAFLIGWLYTPESIDGNKRTTYSIRQGFIFAWPYLAATAAYFLVRFLALGTLIGGYVAGFGASQEKSALTRWLDKDTLERIAFPLVQGHFQASEIISLTLLVLYSVLAAIFIIRIVSRQVPWKIFIFLAGWFVTSLLPIYKLWGIGYNLEGARFLFFFTMPLATALAAGLFQNNDEKEAGALDRSLVAVSSAVAILLTAIFAYVAAKTDLIWVNAGKEVKAAALTARSILATDKSSPAVFLGIPKESKGTHMILNGDTFRAAVSPPFADVLPKRRYATFEPIMYSPEFEIDATRLHQLVAEGAEVFVWSSQKRQFDSVQYTGGKPDSYAISPAADAQGLQAGGQSGLLARSADGIVFRNNDGRQGIQLSDLNLNPLKADFAAIEMKTSEQNPSITVSFAGNQTDPDQLKETLAQTKVQVRDNARFQTVYVPLSRHWKWFQSPSIQTFFLRLPTGQSVVKSIKLLEEKGCVPEIQVLKKSANENGTYELAGASNKLQLKVDGNAVKDANRIVLEISKANFFFDNFKESEGADAVDKRISLSRLTEEHELKRSDFAGSGLFQIRAQTLDKSGASIGAPSRCITIIVH